MNRNVKTNAEEIDAEQYRLHIEVDDEASQGSLPIASASIAAVTPIAVQTSPAAWSTVAKGTSVSPNDVELLENDSVAVFKNSPSSFSSVYSSSGVSKGAVAEWKVTVLQGGGRGYLGVVEEGYWSNDHESFLDCLGFGDFDSDLHLSNEIGSHCTIRLDTISGTLTYKTLHGFQLSKFQSPSFLIVSVFFFQEFAT